MLGLPSALRPCPPSMLPIMLPRPASLNMPCMPPSPPIMPMFIRGMPPELPGTSLMISKPGSSPALDLRSLERNRRSGDARKQCHICRVANGFVHIIYARSFWFFNPKPDYGPKSRIQSFTRDCSSSSPHLLHCHCRQRDSFWGAWIFFIE